MVTLKCKICKKNYGTLADEICYYCNPIHWVIYWNKQFQGKDKK